MKRAGSLLRKSYPKDFTPARLLVFFLFLFSCSTVQKPDITNQYPEKAFLIQNVPFYPQKEELCGPASLQNVFSYWGKKISQEEISKEIFIPQIKGTLNFDLVNFAKKEGFQTETEEGSLKEIERRIREKQPIIVFLNLGTALFPLGHYIVIIGYDHLKKEIIAHSGQNEFERIPYTNFLKQWETTDHWMLIITPSLDRKS